MVGHLRALKEVQLNLWVETLVQLAGRSGGQLRDGVHVTTRRVPIELVAGQRLDPTWAGQ